MPLKPRRMTLVAGGLALAAALAAHLAAQAPAQRASAGPPRLVVFVTVDQMRADYIDRYGHQWKAGLRRLVDTGAYFTRAAYPYGGTVTCPGHATISTGAFPATHGMTSNDWFDYKAGRLMPCMADPGAASIAFGGGTGREHHGPRNMLKRTFAEELRRQSRRRPWVVSVGLKPRSAIALAGKGSPSTIAVWEEGDGTWATSDAYTRIAWPEVDEYVKANPIAAAYGEVWNRLLPAASYLGPDDGPGETSPAPWGRTFPHPLTSKSGKPDDPFVTAWERSPWSDAYVIGLAMALTERFKLGTDQEGTDMLAVALPALDLVGHEYGPTSHEVQDVLARVDVQLGRLMELLDKQVGAGQYTIALSADHGVATLPEQAGTAARAGRMAGAALRDAVQQALVKQLGPGTYPAAYSAGNLYLQAGVADRMRAQPGAIQAAKVALLATGGVERVYWRDQLTSTLVTSDPYLEAWRLSYFEGRSGDFIVIPRRGWVFQTLGTTHGSVYDYDQRVPIIFLGAGIRAGRFTGPATPADIAPTLAALVGIQMPQADGWALKDAIAR